MSKRKNRIIELRVKNHAGVMSHITGLFSRRNFNLEGILCAPLKNSARSRIYLIVGRYANIEQIVKQLQKLYDGDRGFLLSGGAGSLMDRMEKLFRKKGKSSML
jgi:acetolactate synthase-1/3 small subunit